MSRTFFRGLSDVDAVSEGRRLDAEAEAALFREAPEWAERALKKLRATVTTRAPRRHALRAVAKDRAPRAWSLYQQGDAAYWHVVQAHEGFIRQQAYRHARASQVDIDTVLSAVQEAAFDSAVNWDPEKASYTTASVLRLASSWQRANERQSAVVAGDTRELRATTGGFARADVSSLDELLQDDSGTRLLDLIESRDPEAMDYLVARSDRKALEAACAALSTRALDVLRRRQSGETLEEVGTALGVSKERARQVVADAVTALRLAIQRPTRY